MAERPVDIDMDIAGASASIAALQAQMAALRAGAAAPMPVGPAVAPPGGGAGAGGAASGTTPGLMSALIPGIISAVIGLAPAAIPIAGVGVAAAGGLAAGAAGAAGGAGVLGAGIIGQVIEISKAREAAEETGAAIPEYMQPAIDAIDRLGESWRSFTEATQDSSIDLIAGALGVLPPLLEQMSPVFETFADIALGALQDLTAWAEGDGSAAFFEFLDTTGAEAFDGLITLAGSLASMVGGLIEAFGPFGVEVIDNLDRVISRWAEWVNSAEGAEWFEGFIDYARQYAPQVIDLFSSMGDFIANVVEALAPLGGFSLEALTGFFEFIAGVDPSILGAIAVALGVVTGGIAALVSIMLVFNLVARLNPIGLIVTAIAALVAALIYLYNNNEAFRENVQRVWNAIQDAIRVSVEWIRDTAWPVIERVISAIGDGFMWLWENAIKPAADAIGTAFTWLWENVIQPVGQWIGETWTWLWERISWAWENIGRPIFELVSAIVTWLWENVVSLYLSYIQLQWEVLWTAIQWAWENVGQPVFNTVRDIVVWLWENVIQPAFHGIVEVIQDAWATIQWIWENIGKPIFDTIEEVAMWLWHNVIEPAFQAIADTIEDTWDTIKWVWENILKPVFDAIEEGVDIVKQAFDTAVDAIGTAWDRLEDLAKKPVRFVLETVIQEGIIDNFNKLAREFNTPELGIKAWPVPGFNTGGAVPFLPGSKPNQDSMLAMLTPGEYIIPAGATQKLRSSFGDEFLEMLRQGLPGYSRGGLVRFGRFLQSQGYRVAEHPLFGGVAPVHKGRGHYEGRAIDVNWGPPGRSPEETAMLNAIVPLGHQIGLSSIWQSKGHFGHVHFETGARWRGNLGPRIAGSSAGGTWAGIADQILSFMANPIGFLTDLVGGLADRVPGGQVGDIIFGAATDLAGRAGEAAKGLVSGIGDFGETLYEGTLGRVFDSGGYLPPGHSLVYNGTGKPEPVFTNEQWKALMNNRGGTGTTIVIENITLSENDLSPEVLEFFRNIRRKSRQVRV